MDGIVMFKIVKYIWKCHFNAIGLVMSMLGRNHFIQNGCYILKCTKEMKTEKNADACVFCCSRKLPKCGHVEHILQQ